MELSLFRFLILSDGEWTNGLTQLHNFYGSVLIYYMLLKILWSVLDRQIRMFIQLSGLWLIYETRGEYYTIILSTGA